MYLLDTCSWLWLVNGDDDRFSVEARKALDAAERLRVGVISCWEVANLVALGPIHLARDLDTWIDEALSVPKIELIPLSLKVAVESTRLPGVFDRDPADRMLVATARAEGLKMIPPDEKIRSYTHVQSVW